MKSCERQAAEGRVNCGPRPNVPSTARLGCRRSLGGVVGTSLLCASLGCAVGDALEDAFDDDPPRLGAPGGDAGAETGIFLGVTDAHNAARSALDEGLPPLTWSEDIARFAQQWSDDLARRCGTIQHRDQRRYGENIALRGSSRVSSPFSSEQAVAGWVAEEACWDFGTISGSERCDAACVQGLSSNGCGHYTQVVWRNTERVGCGYSTCQSGGYTFEVWVCNYDPPGNYIGQTPY
jgi:hypothetical protein